MNLELPNLDPLWVSAFVTFILVCITAYYAIETRKIRIGSVKPLFALRTGFPISEEPMSLYLMNNGGVAIDVNIDVLIDDVIKHRYYVASIPNDGYVDLHISLKECKENKNKIKVKIDYKNSYSWFKKEQSLNLELEEVTKDGREVKYYYTSIENKLLSINNSFIELLNKVNNDKFKSDNITVYPTEKSTRRNREK
ncbi:MAG: hypothetical protein MUO82_08710 [Candidatus Thermoplasmatota archaeon]|nr:hypothetical protein [Candidatus Thermoplasmatota archaeon]